MPSLTDVKIVQFENGKYGLCSYRDGVPTYNDLVSNQRWWWDPVQQPQYFIDCQVSTVGPVLDRLKTMLALAQQDHSFHARELSLEEAERLCMIEKLAGKPMKIVECEQLSKRAVLFTLENGRDQDEDSSV